MAEVHQKLIKSAENYTALPENDEDGDETKRRKRYGARKMYCITTMQDAN